MTAQRIQTNVVYKHLLNSQQKIVVQQGGTRSGKTYNVLLFIIFEYSLKQRDKTITICRKTFPSVRATVMRDFITILRQYGLYREEHHNKSNSEYKLNNNLIEFISVDQPQKLSLIHI